MFLKNSCAEASDTISGMEDSSMKIENNPVKTQYKMLVVFVLLMVDRFKVKKLSFQYPVDAIFIAKCRYGAIKKGMRRMGNAAIDR